MLRAPSSFVKWIFGMPTTALKHIPIPPNGVDYRGTVVLAPMVRSGELPSRLLALKYGADLVWGPETIDRAMIGTSRRYCPRTNTIVYTRLPSNKVLDHDSITSAEREKLESVLYRIHPTLESRKLIFQLGTAKPELAVAAAKLVAEDVAGIDVNSGCPKPFSTTGGMGAALLKDPDRLCAILEALVREVGEPHRIGISVKIRILDKPEETESLVRRLVKTGITGLTVHCRTIPMRPRERAIRSQLRMIADVCREAGVACLMNGDVESREQAKGLVEEYGVDGAMIATAAEKNPSVFREEGTLPWREVVHEYLHTAMGVENRWGNTKFLLAQLVPGKELVKTGLDKSKSYEDVVQSLGFEDLLEMAKDTDATLLVGKDKMLSKTQKRAAARVVQKERQTNKRTKAVEGSTEEGRLVANGSARAAAIAV